MPEHDTPATAIVRVHKDDHALVEDYYKRRGLVVKCVHDGKVRWPVAEEQSEGYDRYRELED